MSDHAVAACVFAVCQNGWNDTTSMSWSRLWGPDRHEPPPTARAGFASARRGRRFDDPSRPVRLLRDQGNNTAGHPHLHVATTSQPVGPRGSSSRTSDRSSALQRLPVATHCPPPVVLAGPLLRRHCAWNRTLRSGRGTSHTAADAPDSERKVRNDRRHHLVGSGPDRCLDRAAILPPAFRPGHPCSVHARCLGMRCCRFGRRCRCRIIRVTRSTARPSRPR
jgi:hypothetical protein